MDADHASERNGVGFNGADTYIGNAFAQAAHLSPKMAVLGKKIVKKYWSQLPPATYLATGNVLKAKS